MFLLASLGTTFTFEKPVDSQETPKESRREQLERERLQLRTLKIKEKYFGREHFFVSRTLKDLATTQEVLGKKDEALQNRERAQCIECITHEDNLAGSFNMSREELRAYQNEVSATLIQRNSRRFLLRRGFRKALEEQQSAIDRQRRHRSLLIIQKAARKFLKRKYFVEIRLKVLTLQCAFRQRLAQKKTLHRRRDQTRMIKMEASDFAAFIETSLIVAAEKGDANEMSRLHAMASSGHETLLCSYRKAITEKKMKEEEEFQRQKEIEKQRAESHTFATNRNEKRRQIESTGSEELYTPPMLSSQQATPLEEASAELIQSIIRRHQANTRMTFVRDQRRKIAAATAASTTEEARSIMSKVKLKIIEPLRLYGHSNMVRGEDVLIALVRLRLCDMESLAHIDIAQLRSVGLTGLQGRNLIRSAANVLETKQCYETGRGAIDGSGSVTSMDIGTQRSRLLRAKATSATKRVPSAQKSGSSRGYAAARGHNRPLKGVEKRLGSTPLGTSI